MGNNCNSHEGTRKIGIYIIFCFENLKGGLGIDIKILKYVVASKSSGTREYSQ